jgi:hypothetical protein
MGDGVEARTFPGRLLEGIDLPHQGIRMCRVRHDIAIEHEDAGTVTALDGGHRYVHHAGQGAAHTSGRQKDLRGLGNAPRELGKCIVVNGGKFLARVHDNVPFSEQYL